MKKSTTWWLLILILLIGTALRVYNLTAISLWHDEAFSALLIRYPWREMFYRIGLDVHPPFYYVALRFWSYAFGNSLGSLRGFSVFFGVGTVWATYLFIRAAFKSENLALAGAFLIAISPFQIQYVTEARMYTFGTFFLMLSVYFVVKALEAQKKYFEYKAEMKETTGPVSDAVWGWWFLFAMATTVTMYTHYYLFFSVIAIGLFVLYYMIKHYGKNFAGYRYAIAAYILTLILYIPWVPTFLFQFHQVQVTYWIPPVNKWSVLVTNWLMISGAESDASKHSTDIILVLGVLFTLYMLWRVWKKNQSTYKNLVYYALIIPFIGAIALSIKQSIYQDRYFLFAALFYTFALLLFIADFRSKKVRVTLFVILCAVSLFDYWKWWHDLNISANPGMAAAAAFLNANVAPADHLYVGTTFEFFNFRYYNHTGQQALFYAQGINKVSDLPHFSGTALLNDSDLINNLTNAAKPGDIAWMLWTNSFGGTKPQVPANWDQIYQNGWGDVRPYPGTVIYVTEYRVE